MLTKTALLMTCGMIPLCATQAQSKEQIKKPNIILYVADDLGWRDLGCMGSKFYETPNIDKLAKQGILFTNAYAACSVCSPTRASILTGRYPARLGLTDWCRARFQENVKELKAPAPFEENGNRKLRTPSNPYWMELSEITIAELLRDAGYFTCYIGKWHLGPDNYYPEKQGYDINIAGSDMGQPVNYFDPYTDKDGVTFPNLKPRKKGEYLEDRLADELLNIVRNHKDKPFFIHMNNYAVHAPLMAKQNLVDKYKAKHPVDGQKNPVYAGMVESVDHTMGLLMDELEKYHLTDNTIIIFLSDNGGLVPATDNSPLRAGKGYQYEGGIRVPFIAKWPGKIKAGTTSNLPISTVDIFPTLCSITGVKMPDRSIDGRNILPALTGKEMKEVPLYWHFPHYRLSDVVPYSIVRDGDWKLIKYYEGKPYELFNLKNDLSEKNDLSGKNPEMVKKLDNELTTWLTSVNAKLPVVK